MLKDKIIRIRNAADNILVRVLATSPMAFTLMLCARPVASAKTIDEAARDFSNSVVTMGQLCASAVESVIAVLQLFKWISGDVSEKREAKKKMIDCVIFLFAIWLLPWIITSVGAKAQQIAGEMSGSSSSPPAA